MKKTILCLAVATLLQIAGNAQKISELPAPASSLVSTDIVAVVTGGVTSRARLSDLLALSPAITALTGDVTATGPGSVAATLDGIWGNAGYIDRREVFRTNYFFSNLGVGTTDLYTVASTNKVILQGTITLGTTNGSGSSVFTYFKTNSTYWRAAGSASSSTGSVGSINIAYQMLYPGETIAISNTASGLNVVLPLMLLPSSYRFVSGRNIALTGGNDTLYTTPTGYTLDKPVGDGLGTGTSIVASLSNSSGATVVISVYVVPSGGSPSDGNRLATVSVANNTTSTAVLPNLDQGESIVVASSSAAADQSAYVTVGFERPR